MRKWITPWELPTMKSKPHNPATMQKLHQKLFDYGFRIDHFKKPPEDIRIIKLIQHLLNVTDDMKEEKKIPWVLLACNDGKILEVCGELLPIMYTLTHAASVFSTDTDFIFRHYVQDMKDTDPFGPDFTGRVLDDIKYTDLLWWKNIGQPVAGSLKYAGRFAQISGYRSGNELTTIFTHRYLGEFKAKKFWEGIAPIFGESVAGDMKDQCAIQIVKVKRPEMGVEEIEL